MPPTTLEWAGCQGGPPPILLQVPPRHLALETSWTVKIWACHLGGQSLISLPPGLVNLGALLMMIKTWVRLLVNALPILLQDPPALMKLGAPPVMTK